MGALAPFDNIDESDDWAKPDEVIKKQKTKTKTEGKQYFLYIIDFKYI